MDQAYQKAHLKATTTSTNTTERWKLFIHEIMFAQSQQALKAPTKENRYNSSEEILHKSMT